MKKVTLEIPETSEAIVSCTAMLHFDAEEEALEALEALKSGEKSLSDFGVNEYKDESIDETWDTTHSFSNAEIKPFVDCSSHLRDDLKPMDRALQTMKENVVKGMLQVSSSFISQELYEELIDRALFKPTGDNDGFILTDTAIESIVDEEDGEVADGAKAILNLMQRHGCYMAYVL